MRPYDRVRPPMPGDLVCWPLQYGEQVGIIQSVNKRGLCHVCRIQHEAFSPPYDGDPYADVWVDEVEPIPAAELWRITSTSDDPEVTTGQVLGINEARALRGLRAIKAAGGSGETETLEEEAIDAIANIMHMAARRGLDYAAICRMATSHVTEERGG